jgi:predicted alpha/beta superfamily hydrolase
MKKLLLILIASFFAASSYTQNRNDIVAGKIDSIESEILNEQRLLWIHLPYSYSADKSYPVVYLLDGNYNFGITYSIIEHLSMLRDPICPEMIIVGITNTDRTRDLTPYKPFPLDSIMPPQMVAASGGGEKFISFIEKELMPYIEAKYSTAPYRTFIGHSLGGLTVLNTLLHHTDLFDAYIALDPTTNWVKGRLIQEFKDFKATKTDDMISLFIGMGSLNIGQNKNDVLADTSYWAEGFPSLFELNEFLITTPPDNLNYSSKFYKYENHFSLPLIASYDAFRFIFDFYKVDLTTSDWENPRINLAEKIRNLYERRTEGLGYLVKPGENYINDLANYYLSLKHYEKARQLFELNVYFYPANANVYESIGDYYTALNDKNKAIKNYKKALSLSEKESTRSKLNNIQN